MDLNNSTKIGLGVLALFLLSNRSSDSNTDNVVITNTDPDVPMVDPLGGEPPVVISSCSPNSFTFDVGGPLNHFVQPIQQFRDILISWWQKEPEIGFIQNVMTDYEVIRLYTCYFLHVQHFGNSRPSTNRLQADIGDINEKYKTRFPIY